MAIAFALSGFNDFVLSVTPTFTIDFLLSVKKIKKIHGLQV